MLHGAPAGGSTVTRKAVRPRTPEGPGPNICIDIYIYIYMQMRSFIYPRDLLKTYFPPGRFF